MNLHDTERISQKDRFVICGVNPDKEGGGIIATRDTWDGAVTFKVRAIKAGYGKVEIMTWKEFLQS